ncbi:MAG: hypothetical protein K0S39_6070 [Paenibacillus sp.]|jgi:replicative DNA helicase|nr:hypothetical protein [Paenibacillus sp.]
MANIEELQMLNYVLLHRDFKILEHFKLSDEHFIIQKEPYQYIKSFLKKYGHPPTIETVMNQFQNFELVELENLLKVSEALIEDALHRKTKPLLQAAANLVIEKKTTEAIQKLHQESGQLLKEMNVSTSGYSYVQNAGQRLNNYLNIHGRKEGQILGITTGLYPLDIAVNGLEYMDGAVDYFLIFAPTNMGKTLFSSFMLQSGWGMALPTASYPAYFALEQRAKEIANNWDSQLGGISRLALSRGIMPAEMKDRYVAFIDYLRQRQKDIAIYDLDSNGGKPYSIEDIHQRLEREGHTMFALDQLSKVRYTGQFEGANLRQRLFNTSALTREMILDLGIPGYVLAQANRASAQKVKKDSTEDVEAEDIGEAYAIVQDATKGVSIVKINKDTFRLQVIKNRENASGQKFLVRYSFDSGTVSVVDHTIGEQHF